MAAEKTTPKSAPAEGNNVQVRSFAGRDVFFDSEGFLVDPSQWSEDMAALLARESRIDLLEENHWRVIRFIRDYYLQNGRAPLHRELRKGVGMSLMDIESLFPDGIKMGARRLAGLPNPKTCGM